MLELLELKKANELPILAGNQPAQNTATQNSSLLAQANSYVSDKTGINAKELLVKYVGQEPIDKLKVEANFLEKFPAIALQQYGLDAPRILLQRDPHANKKLAAKASNIAGNIIGKIPLIGKISQKGLKLLTNDIEKPLYPDDWLTNPDTDNPTFEGYYTGLYKHTISNNHGILGNFINEKRTLKQLKESVIPTGLSLLSSVATYGIQKSAKFFGGKTTAIRKKGAIGWNNKYEDRKNKVYFPTMFAVSTGKMDETDIVMFNGQQQLRNDDFPTIGTPMYSTGSISLAEPDKNTYLRDYYTKYMDEYLKYSNKYWSPSDQKTKQPNRPAGFKPTLGYTSRLQAQGEYDINNVFGEYSKDVLRIYNGVTGKWSDRYPSIYEVDNNSDGFYSGSVHLNWYTSDISSVELSAQIQDATQLTANKSGSQWLTYNSAFGEIDYSKYNIKPIRWNTSKAPYSKQNNPATTDHNEILDMDYYFASSSVQSQNSQVSSSVINPYLQQKRKILSSTAAGSDRIKFSIGGTDLLATLTGLTDNTTPTWSDTKGVGSGYKFYFYDNWEREISFKFQMYAESEAELKMIYEKANTIKALTLPTAGGILGVMGKKASLIIGDLIDITYGFLTQCNLTVIDDSPWEITNGSQSPFIYEMDITYKALYDPNKLNQYGTPTGNAFPLTTKFKTTNPTRVTAPAQKGGPVDINKIPTNTIMDSQGVVPEPSRGFTMPNVNPLGAPATNYLGPLEPPGMTYPTPKVYELSPLPVIDYDANDVMEFMDPTKLGM